MATKIRLMRLGKIRAPYYRIVVADSRTKRDGRVIETIGKYHPKQDPSLIEVDSERAQYWLSVGAQPTEPVAAILRVTGDWQRYKGEPAPTEGVKTAAPRADRKAIFEAAAKETFSEDVKPAKKVAPKKEEASEAAAPAEDAASTEDAAPTADAAATDAAEAAPAAEATDAPAEPAEAAPEAAADQAPEAAADAAPATEEAAPEAAAPEPATEPAPPGAEG